MYLVDFINTFVYGILGYFLFHWTRRLCPIRSSVFTYINWGETIKNNKSNKACINMLYSIVFIPIAVLFGHLLIPHEMMIGKRNRRCQNFFYKKIILLCPQQSQRFPCFVRTKKKTNQKRKINPPCFFFGLVFSWRRGLLIVSARTAREWFFYFLISFQQKALKGFHHNHVAALLAYLSTIYLNLIFSLEIILLMDHLSVPPRLHPMEDCEAR